MCPNSLLGLSSAVAFHVFDARAPWIKEFASALDRIAFVCGWHPEMEWFSYFRSWEREQILADPGLRIRHFSMQRGRWRLPASYLRFEASKLVDMLLRRTPGGNAPTLVCCMPHFAKLAEAWPGRLVYYLTDMVVEYRPRDRKRVVELDTIMCRKATLVAPDSQRIADYLMREARCPSEKILISPMATRQANLFAEPSVLPTALPSDIQDLPRPVAAVIGNLARNMDWCLLEAVVRVTPWLSWVFVGPATMTIDDRRQRKSRETLMTKGERVRFVGAKAYSRLRDYARCCDVALLPYRRVEPTYSGSSTRFYEHLAACRPMLATRGFEELLHKEPLLKLADTVDEIVEELERLRSLGFQDGLEAMRWEASKRETWEVRARDMVAGLYRRCSGG
jgi:hypothetical protein